MIAYDADAVSKELVRIARSALAAHLRGRDALVGFLEWDIERGKGMDDHLAAVGTDMVLDEIAHVDFAGSAWKKDLLRSKPDLGRSSSSPPSGAPFPRGNGRRRRREEPQLLAQHEVGCSRHLRVLEVVKRSAE